jgi:hypothetical protein
MRLVEQVAEFQRVVTSSPVIDAMRAAEEHAEALRSVVDSPVFRSIAESQKVLDHLGAVTSMKKAIAAAFPRGVDLKVELASTAFTDALMGTSALRDIAEASRQWTDLTRSVAGELQCSSIVSELAASLDAFKGLNIPSFNEQFEPIARILRETHSVMGAVQWDGIAALKLEQSIVTGLEVRTDRLTRAYAGLSDWMITHPSEAVAAPPFMSRLPTLSVYSHAEALRTFGNLGAEEVEEQEADEQIWSDVRDETMAAINALLPAANPRLVPVWKGAWKTARRREDDWVRQAASSMRHVLITILDTVAPKDRVKAEIDRRYLNEKSEVIRRTQVAWLCKPLGNKPHAKVTFQDIESAIAVIDAMSEAVHEDECPEVEKAFDRMALRAAVALQHLLEVHLRRK